MKSDNPSGLRTIRALLVGFVALSCSVPPERPLLEHFFAASRIRDRTALNNIATVIFEPREQGTIIEFDITNVLPRREANREFKDVTISAPIRLPGGQTVRKTLVVTMEKIDGRWLVTGVGP